MNYCHKGHNTEDTGIKVTQTGRGTGKRTIIQCKLCYELTTKEHRKRGQDRRNINGRMSEAALTDIIMDLSEKIESPGTMPWEREDLIKERAKYQAMVK